MSEIDEEVWVSEEIDLPVRRYEPTPEGLRVMIKFHEKHVHRFLDWLQAEGLTVCKGAMPVQLESLKEQYHKHEYERRGLCVPSAS